MNPSLQLLHLVRGLDRGEVRYFRAYARRTVAEGSAALALFDLILKRKTYDEDEIARIVNVSNFPALKVYLRDMIADAILEQEMKRKGVSELLALCRQIEIFQERELPQLVWLRLEKALAICSAFEEFYIWRGLIEKKRRMVVLADGVSFGQNELELLNAQYHQVQLQFSNLEIYTELEQRVLAALTMGYEACTRLAQELKICAFLQPSAPRLSVRAELKFLFVTRHLHRWHGNIAGMLSASEAVVALYESHPHLLNSNDDLQSYAERLFFIGWNNISNGEIDPASKAIAKLKGLSRFPYFVFERVHRLELRLALYHLDIIRGDALVDAIQKGFEAHSLVLKAEHVITLSYQISVFYIYLGEPRKAIRWIQRIRSTDQVGYKGDLKNFAEILHLVCHYDLGNIDVLKSEILSIRKYFLRLGLLSPFFNTVLEGLQLLSVGDQRADLETITSIKQMIQGSANHSEGTWLANYFDFDTWLESKLTGGSPASLHRSHSDSLRKFRL